MDTIGNILSGRKGKTGIMKSIASSMVVEFVSQWIQSQWGAAANDQARVVSLKGKTVTIACLSAAMANEIKFHERALLAAINRKFGEDTVIKFKFLL